MYEGGDWVLQAGVNHDGFCSPDDARRIVACVNFLRGVPQEELEQALENGKLRGLIGEIRCLADLALYIDQGC